MRNLLWALRDMLRWRRSLAVWLLLAVLTTGAYNFTMASNYNRLCRPALVMVRNGKARLAVRRQTFADLVACDL